MPVLLHTAEEVEQRAIAGPVRRHLAGFEREWPIAEAPPGLEGAERDLHVIGRQDPRVQLHGVSPGNGDGPCEASLDLVAEALLQDACGVEAGRVHERAQGTEPVAPARRDGRQVVQVVQRHQRRHRVRR